jgi:hypothetical protein
MITIASLFVLSAIGHILGWMGIYLQIRLLGLFMGLLVAAASI